jgi:hypothetical protein
LKCRRVKLIRKAIILTTKDRSVKTQDHIVKTRRAEPTTLETTKATAKVIISVVITEITRAMATIIVSREITTVEADLTRITTEPDRGNSNTHAMKSTTTQRKRRVTTLMMSNSPMNRESSSSRSSTSAKRTFH